MEFFDSWRPASAQVAVESDWARYCPFSAQSAPLLLPSAASAADTVQLPLFGAASASTTGAGLAAAAADADGTSAAAAAAGAAADGLSAPQAKDVALFAGGPVWALDWCPAGTAAPHDALGGGEPAAAAAAPAADYLAVGCHPPDAAQHVIGTAVQGPACLQVWELSHPGGQQQQQGQQGQQQGYRRPRMALALAHDGGLAWHCQWCPSAALADEPAGAGAGGSSSSGVAAGTMPRLGLLAAALGDGSVRVWAVPHPQAAGQLRQQRNGASEAPLVLSVPPVAVATSAAMGGSLPCLVDWLPAPPHDLLAVGCWDGSVAVFKLAPAQQQQQQQQQGGGASALRDLVLLSRFSADVLPLRTLRWVAPSGRRAMHTVDSLHRHVLLTGGHEGTLRVWDVRDPFQPIYGHVMSSNSAILAGDWTAAPFGITLACEDGSLRGVALDSGIIESAAAVDGKAMFCISWRGHAAGAFWALAVHPALQLIAYGGEDGLVGLFRAEYVPKANRRQPHTAVAGTRLEGDALVLKTQSQLGRSGLFADRVVERATALNTARLPEVVEAIHRVAWSRHAGGSAWLASAGAAGIVRCQWVAAGG